jgi:hypothetical protein
MFCFLYTEAFDAFLHKRLVASVNEPEGLNNIPRYCILLYCSEVWSLNIIKDNKILESKYWNMAPVKIQIKFAKFLIGVNKAAVNAAVL